MLGEGGELVVYRSEDGSTRVQLRAVEGTVWLTQVQIAELYNTSVPNVAQIMRRILEDGELTEATLNSELRVRAEGARQVRREVKIYNLDMVLAVGYRVTNGHTAAELVVKRCDPTAPNLGLTTWDGDRVRMKDVDVAKNYLSESEVSELNRLTTMFLDFAEDRARRRQEVRMADWITQTDRFLVFNERDVLEGPGRVSAESAKEITAERYAEFAQRRRDEEAERAAIEEWDDLRELTAIERGRPDEDET